MWRLSSAYIIQLYYINIKQKYLFIMLTTTFTFTFGLFNEIGNLYIKFFFEISFETNVELKLPSWSHFGKTHLSKKKSKFYHIFSNSRPTYWQIELVISPFLEKPRSNYRTSHCSHFIIVFKCTRYILSKDF